MACYVSAVYITRPDVREKHLSEFVDWIHEVVAGENRANFKRGAILCLAGVFKHGQRDHLLPLAPIILRNILSVQFTPSELYIVRKPLVKLSQRIG